MDNQLIITIDSKVNTDFAVNFLKNVNFIKAIKLRKEKSSAKGVVEEVTLMAEKSLAEEWLSEEDNRWDKVL
jgi:hypothetical protein